jgi:hypothetical protein
LFSTIKEYEMPDGNSNPCEQLLPGSSPCLKQIDNRGCALQKPGRNACAGKIAWGGANVSKARTYIAAKGLEAGHTTGQKVGHLCDALRPETLNASVV